MAQVSFGDGGVPNGLRCLATYYAITPSLTDAGWVAVLPDGARLSWDDGRTKTAEQRVQAPDLQDVFAERYGTGRIGAPVNDSGRVRVDALFKATYGANRDHVSVVPFDFFGQSLWVHRRALHAFSRVRAALKDVVAKDPSTGDFLSGVGGTFEWRNIAGTTRLSAHSFGISIDLNVKRSNYWRWDEKKKPKPGFRNQVPQSIVDAFERNGFIWGGRWVHYDTMHFELRPELLDPSCY